jgi:hypothetical protein
MNRQRLDFSKRRRTDCTVYRLIAIGSQTFIARATFGASA